MDNRRPRNPPEVSDMYAFGALFSRLYNLRFTGRGFYAAQAYTVQWEQAYMNIERVVPNAMAPITRYYLFLYSMRHNLACQDWLRRVRFDFLNNPSITMVDVYQSFLNDQAILSGSPDFVDLQG